MEIQLKQFPRYTREENLGCKLTQQQINDIPVLKSQDLSLKDIAQLYNVTPQAIYYWSISEEDRKKKNKKTKRQGVRFDAKAYRERKMKLHPELLEYENQFTEEVRKERRPEHKENCKKADKNYREKHKEELKVKNKKYQQANLDKFREYNRRHNLKLKQERLSKSI